MPYLKFTLILTLLVSATMAKAALRAVGPIDLAKKEDITTESLRFQTGCARPDLSDSLVDGSAAVDITFNETGSPIEGKIVSSNGSELDNQKILEAFTKRCRYTRFPTEVPYGFTKRFTYSWKAHTQFTGLQQCMIFQPIYPPASLRLKEEGKTEARYRYLASGGYELNIAKSSGSERLDDTALRIFRICLENKAVQAEAGDKEWSTLSMNFKLTPSTE